MNDFTKEELFEILGLASNAYGIKGRTMPIIVKLQYMIDNYCEHESDALTPSGIISSCEGDIYTPFKCKKCGEYYDNQ